MFDPTIYSLQSLPPSSSFPATPDSGGLDNPPDDAPTSDTPSKETGSLSDIVVIGAGDIPLLNDDAPIADDSTESLSRKTSTASEYTSLSDYTPEHTVNTATPSTSSSQATVSHLFRPEAIPPLPIDQEPEPTVVVVEPAPPPVKPVATRKISRFLVSPAIMPVGELNLDPTSAKSLASAIASASSSAVAYQPVLDMLESGLYNPLEAAGSNGDQAGGGLPVTTAQDMLDATNVLLAANHNNIAPRPPDQINTLEQLKIGLENITHAHVVQSQQQQQLRKDEQSIVLDGDQPVLEQLIEPPASQEPLAEPTAVYSMEQQPQTQPQSGSGGSQNASVYNSRRTSADIQSTDNTPTSFESPSITGYAIVNEQQQQQQQSPTQPAQQQLPQQQHQQTPQQQQPPRNRLVVQQTSVDNSDG